MVHHVPINHTDAFTVRKLGVDPLRVDDKDVREVDEVDEGEREEAVVDSLRRPCLKNTAMLMQLAGKPMR